MATSKETASKIWKMINEDGMTPEEVAEMRGCKRKTVIDNLARYKKMVESDYLDEVINSEPIKQEELVTENEVRKEYEDLELEHERLIKEYSKEMKGKQRMMDQLRILRKERREENRVDNAIGALSKELVEINRKYGEKIGNVEVPKLGYDSSKKVGVIQISDWHSNEIINLPNNQYDFNILAKRAKKLIDEAIFLFNAHGIKKVLLASTGDMLNSDRRLDEILNQCVNRSKATILTQHIILQMILHLRQHFEVNIVSVLGNESRVGIEWHSSNNVVSDNYDFLIFANLKQIIEFSGIDGVTFGDIDKMESVVDLLGQKWLLSHDVGRATDKQKDTQSKIGAYYLKGMPIDFILSGHIHASRSTDLSSRSASMAGSNEYNEHKMNLVGYSAQNLFIVGEGGDRQSIVVNLQNTDGIDGYSVEKELEAYNAKSSDKVRDDVAILKIVI